MNSLLAYIDFLWLPVAWLTVTQQQRWKAFGFVLTCLLTLRTQVELMEYSGFPTGFLPILDSHVLPRGMMTYSAIILLYLIMAWMSPRTGGIIFFAASLSIYIVAFCLSMLIMAL